MGFHYIDIIVIVAIAMLILGPKTVQSMARGAGKSMKQVKSLKEDLLSDLPKDEISQVTNHISKIPTSPFQVAQLLMAPEPTPTEKPQAQEPKKE
jgi:Sec-independent protein translocase protein TatA